MWVMGSTQLLGSIDSRVYEIYAGLVDAETFNVPYTIYPIHYAGSQDSRLNYIEQHLSSRGVDASRLDSARVSAARSSPMGDTLELCARYTDAATLEALVPRLVPLVCTRSLCPCCNLLCCEHETV